jgi:PilZ domain
MVSTRRVSPRIPYDEAICLTRIDGQGRLYGRGMDLSATGLSVICAEACPVGTAVRFSLLLLSGPRAIVGRVVRTTALPRGLGVAIAFEGLTPGVSGALERLIEARTTQSVPAKLRVDGVERLLRCEARVDEQMVRLTATLPFLRLDGGVDVELGERGVTTAGVIRKITLDPTNRDGVPRLAVDVALDGVPRTETARYGTPARPMTQSTIGPDEPTPPPVRLPPACGRPLPSVVLAAGLQRDLRAVEARPPRRRVHGTAEVARHPSFGPWRWPPEPALAIPAATLPTQRLTALDRAGTRGLWLLVPVVLALAAAAVHLHG